VPPSLGDRLAHIIEAIDTIQSILADKNLNAVSKDRMLHLALERAFEIICEASRYVPEAIRTRHPEIDWRSMTDLGNLLRHAYHRVDVARLMKIAGADLPPLKAFVERILDKEKKR
jgi:uncharacterized protein with HEPN domain